MQIIRTISGQWLTGISTPSVCVFSTLRAVSLIELSYADMSYTMIDLQIWSSLEAYLGIINACFPVMQPALAKIFGTRTPIRLIKARATSYTWMESCQGQLSEYPEPERRRFRRFRDPGDLFKNGSVTASDAAYSMPGFEGGSTHDGVTFSLPTVAWNATHISGNYEISPSRNSPHSPPPCYR